MKTSITTFVGLGAVVFFTTLTAMAQAVPAGQGVGPQHGQQNAGVGKPAMLGVRVERISEDLRYQLPAIKPGAGLIIREVVPNSPAAQARLEPMDILLMWDDQWLVHPAQLQVLAQSAQPGDKVNLEYLHRGGLTKTEITLAEETGGGANDGAPHRRIDAGSLGALLGNDVIKQAADALAKSGIDPNGVAGMLKGMDSGKFDPASLLGGRIVLVAPDGTRREINIGDLLKSDGNPGELLKGMDPGGKDPAALLGSKILLIGPDGREKEIKLDEILKSAAAIEELLKGMGQHHGR